ncbi:MYND-type domain-containing protein [Mycena chlorophos]|uniref:MYND-type domain-containing protein n=1 Tax=Mycena chlorophos TaxID=658473 RepID=A0A8H6WL84_MYCCL|nr:MYND-type domain-containing protein [Mycena chlorophos]
MDLSRRRAGVIALYQVALRYRKLTPDQLEEVFLGLGSSIDGVAALMTAALKRVMSQVKNRHRPRPLGSDIDDELALFGATRVCMINIGTLVPGFRDILARSMDGALLSRALKEISVMLEEDRRKHRKPRSQWPQLATSTILVILEDLIVSSRTHLRAALEQNVLRSIAVLCRDGSSTCLAPDVEHFLLEILHPATLFSDLHPLLSSSLADEETSTISRDPAFKRNAFFQPWDRFIQMVKFHEAIFASLPDPQLSLAACDDLSCGHIAQKSIFQRCSGCRARLYCSSSCQASDWGAGEHRAACALYRAVRESSLETFTRRELRDIRTVLTYHLMKGPIGYTLSTSNALPGIPNASIFINLAAWSPSDPQDPSSELGPTIEQEHHGHPLPTWADWTKRIQRSNGRMALHVVQITLGRRKQQAPGTTLVFALRESSSFMRDAGCRILESIEGEGLEGEALARRFQSEWDLLELPSDLVQIYR